MQYIIEQDNPYDVSYYVTIQEQFLINLWSRVILVTYFPNCIKINTVNYLI